ncbi:MAG: aldo/keto reductase [Clostridia bacterium]|nr:aldo/keto reductase [Clostridia bacterium]
MDRRDLFGFGTMRLPILDKNDSTSFDYEKIKALFDRFIERGFSYFDTAYTYHKYQCEKAVKKCLVDRYPRDKFEIATKMPLRDFKDEADLETKFQEQLTNLGVEFFDYYLLHNMGFNVYDKCEKYKAFDFVKRKKEQGYIKKLGMSFHDTPELLEQILEKHSDIFDFVQLQINYVDFDQINVRGRECLAIANRYNLPVIVMEPCKGGTLINVPSEVVSLMKNRYPNQSIVSWALRFSAMQKGVIKVLSGMNDMSQIDENCEVFENFRPLDSNELKLIDEVTKIINDKTAIKCTNCEYCTHGCPKNIPINKYFGMYNSIMRNTGDFSSQKVYYRNAAFAGYGKASECIKCGKCEQACPQHLPIREYLEQVKEKLE